MAPEQFYNELWQDYIQLTPQAARVHALFTQDGHDIVNDHVAFRTFNIDPVGIKAFEPHLLDMGYQLYSPYSFEEKKLDALSYVPSDPRLPRVFFSELKVEELSATAQQIIHKLCEQIEPGFTVTPETFWSGRPWPVPSWDDYQQLLNESEYAAWVASIGIRANHFTISINQLRNLSIQNVVEKLESAGFAMNQAGGVIKGTPATLLEQCSTMADKIDVTFADGNTHSITSCYYEFALRHLDEDGELYQGFVAANADKIFHSTDTKSA